MFGRHPPHPKSFSPLPFAQASLRCRRAKQRFARSGEGLICVLLAALLLLALPAQAADDPVFGTWLTQDGEAWIGIEPCGAELCGKIVWVADPFNDDGSVARDDNNPDPARRNQTIVGLPLLKGFRRHDDGYWRGGTIYNPENGKDYHCNIRMQDPDTLHLRCFVGIPLFGATQLWKRTSGPIPPEPPAKPGKRP